MPLAAKLSGLAGFGHDTKDVLNQTRAKDWKPVRVLRTPYFVA